MKGYCQRCNKLKLGIDKVYIPIINQSMFICGSCQSKVSNLITTYNYSSTSTSYKNKILKTIVKPDIYRNSNTRNNKPRSSLICSHGISLLKECSSCKK